MQSEGAGSTFQKQNNFFLDSRESVSQMDSQLKGSPGCHLDYGW